MTRFVRLPAGAGLDRRQERHAHIAGAAHTSRQQGLVTNITLAGIQTAPAAIILILFGAVTGPAPRSPPAPQARHLTPT